MSSSLSLADRSPARTIAPPCDDPGENEEEIAACRRTHRVDQHRIADGPPQREKPEAHYDCADVRRVGSHARPDRRLRDLSLRSRYFVTGSLDVRDNPVGSDRFRIELDGGDAGRRAGLDPFDSVDVGQRRTNLPRAGRAVHLGNRKLQPLGTH